MSTGHFFSTCPALMPCPVLREKMVYKKISFLSCPALCHRTGQGRAGCPVEQREYFNVSIRLGSEE